MLTIEQYASPEVMATYREFFMDGPIAFQSELFSRMIAQGYFREGDAKAMALQFYGPIFLLLSRCAGPGDEADCLALLERHVAQFAADHGSGAEK